MTVNQEGEKAGSSTDQQTSAGEKSVEEKAERTFTQRDIDKIVSKRVNEVQSKYADYEQVREKAQVLDNMLDDERFQTFLSGLSEGRSASETSKSEGSQDSFASAPEVERLKKLDPDLADAFIGTMRMYESQINDLRHTIEARIDPIEKTQAQIRAEGILKEIKSMRDDPEKWPHMQDEKFLESMTMAMKARMAGNIVQAYDVATAQWTREGRSLPQKPSLSQAKKEKAQLLEGRGGKGSIDKEPEKPPKFKNARESAEWAMKSLGWM